MQNLQTRMVLASFIGGKDGIWKSREPKECQAREKAWAKSQRTKKFVMDSVFA